MEVNANPELYEVMTAEPPIFDDDYVISLVKTRFGFDATTKRLLSERDQNFLVTSVEGAKFVLKIANPEEDVSVTDFQIQALLHIEQKNPRLSVPRVIRGVQGETGFGISDDRQNYFVRMVSYLQGTPFDGLSCSSVYRYNLGRELAALGHALKDFVHPGAYHSLLWDMSHALELRQMLGHIPDQSARGDVASTLDIFETDVQPVLGKLRAQVIHNDLNPGNALVAENDPNQVGGIIDFGDMVHGPLIVDVAVAAAYHRALQGNPLEQIAHFLAGYSSVTALEQQEIDLLFDLIKTRLATTVAILYWRASRKGPDDPYLADAFQGESTSTEYLHRLAEVPRKAARDAFRQVCASSTGRSIV